MEINSTQTEALNIEAVMEASKSSQYSNGQTTIQD